METDFYQRLSPPYNAKNGPLDDITVVVLRQLTAPPTEPGRSSHFALKREARMAESTR